MKDRSSAKDGVPARIRFRPIQKVN